MHKALVTLIDLQELDARLKHLEAAKGDLPHKVQSLNAQVEETNAWLEQKIAEKESTSAERVATINDAELLKEKLKKYKVQLYAVKTNKEYDAITMEIETAEQKIDEQEYKSLELEESLSQLEEMITSTQKRVEEMRESLIDYRKDLEAKLATTRAEEEVLRSRRLEMVKNLPKPVLSAYERIRQGRGGVAVAKLINGACSECSSRIPPQRALEIRMMDKINLCEVCGRIVVWKEDYLHVEESQ
ncbi:hypothetical protein JXA02_12830 [candidate division KSB1 bacterium]|nr:hypothetical protein [candidate division KSB1 bacterium]